MVLTSSEQKSSATSPMRFRSAIPKGRQSSSNPKHNPSPNPSTRVLVGFGFTEQEPHGTAGQHHYKQ